MPTLNWIAVALGIVASIAGALHALFNKRDPRSAAAWIAICLMWPLVGALIYLTFGKNRIKTRARQLHGSAEPSERMAIRGQLAMSCSGKLRPGFQGLANLSGATSLRRLLGGNQIELLVNGEQAYPAMLQAIDAAEHSVYLGSYIFDGGGVGRRFVDSLVAARARGVEVRVLIDGVGRMYSWPRAHRRLKKRGVPVAIYLPPSLLPPKFTINLRNHRKILVIDGEQAFTGGINIRQDHLVQSASKRRQAEDIHFRVQGPVVQQLQEVFVSDWRFSSNLFISPRAYQKIPTDEGACCRVITDGPNDDMDKLLRILIGAIDAASQSVLIMTPYFVPEKELEVALQNAALRGVRVRLILPGTNNMPFVNWAVFHMIGDMLECGVECYLYKGSFVHSKLFVVDEYYVLIGSFNLDPRSLKLNFEVAVESYSESAAAPLVEYFETRATNSSLLGAEQLAKRSPLKRFIGGIFWLMSPYL